MSRNTDLGPIDPDQVPPGRRRRFLGTITITITIVMACIYRTLIFASVLAFGAYLLPGMEITVATCTGIGAVALAAASVSKRMIDPLAILRKLQAADPTPGSRNL